MRILLAEDDPAIAKHLMSALEAAGYQAENLSNGLEIWEKGDDGGYDAVILDLGLPGLDGMSILRRWRKEGQ